MSHPDNFLDKHRNLNWNKVMSLKWKILVVQSTCPLVPLKEATFLLHSYGIKCDYGLVEEWIEEGKIKGTNINGIIHIGEDEVHEFLNDYQWNGTAYETGIDDQTKINRLMEEINDYRKEKEELLKEIRELQLKLAEFGVMPF
jgi:hypothetical protein